MVVSSKSAVSIVWLIAMAMVTLVKSAGSTSLRVNGVVSFHAAKVHHDV